MRISLTRAYISSQSEGGWTLVSPVEGLVVLRAGARVRRGLDSGGGIGFFSSSSSSDSSFGLVVGSCFVTVVLDFLDGGGGGAVVVVAVRFRFPVMTALAALVVDGGGDMLDLVMIASSMSEPNPSISSSLSSSSSPFTVFVELSPLEYAKRARRVEDRVDRRWGSEPALSFLKNLDVSFATREVRILVEGDSHSV